ncbi:adenylosuccinate synthase [Paenibacillus roseipurpureus]|uniref:Adenylosuccinate synthetase n=1 Tax=Paenibacillus roseopurpureus TaxID=2918901 RepID=A0AA96LL22_9BACL|nr:adenylosuccinate synthase [Paenibacillus sp. MBLB1832]WNR43847.1 adenylosuccinate synthase [Paenibacillus sp. MBLB1832]
MTVTAIVGANWGDEGKGKFTDLLAAKSGYVVRYQGGSNAGHTIINQYGKFALHLLPSGVCHAGVTNVIGPGVALNIRALQQELAQFTERGMPAPKLRISDRAQVLLPYHILLDELEEERLGARKFGSTKQGIAPFYADKYAKLGIQVADLWDEAQLREKLTASTTPKNVLLHHLYQKPAIDVEEIVALLRGQADFIRPYVCDTTDLLHEALAKKESILVEGQLGALRDPDHGIYPYTTSSSTLAGFAAVGAGLTPHCIQTVVAVTKAYSSCAGEGAFVTELFEEEAEELRKRGGDAGEYGVTTGRPRRVGWFDAVATRYGCKVQGATEVALTNLDVLGYLTEIEVCYAYEIDGVETTSFPNPSQLVRAIPLYEKWQGWGCDISQARSFAELPQQAQAYVRRIEQLIGVDIRWISVGPHRDQTIDMQEGGIRGWNRPLLID